MDRADALRLLGSSRLAHLATTTPEGHPHIVPVTFALLEDTVVHMVDHKPKTTRNLARLDNIAADSRASLLADHYEEDWDALWWVRVDGTAEVVTEGPRVEEARTALVAKYPGYRQAPPEGPAVLLSIGTVRWWASAG